MMANGKRIVVSVISDLVSDQRVHKICLYLVERGYIVILVGRRFADSAELEPRPYKTERIHCIFRKGLMQYAEFNLKLFLKLLQKKTDLFLSNDLDTLLPNFLLARLRGKRLVYDSHEYFTGTPELATKPFKQNIWKSLERAMLPRIKDAYTVNASIAATYQKQFGIDMKVVRNVPLCNQPFQAVDVMPFPPDRYVLLMQGAGIHRSRGAEEVIESMALLPQPFLLVFIGGGDLWRELQEKVWVLKLEEKVWFIPRVPFQKLRAYTQSAQLGLSLDKPAGPNHRMSLPNKVFDYIHAGLPVLVSPIFEVKQVVEKYNIGLCLSEIKPQAIADAIMWIHENKNVYELWKTNTKTAMHDSCWENEVKVLDEIFND